MDETNHTISGFAEVNRARLYYEVAGEGPALLLLHAGVADLRMWDLQFQTFAQRYRVIRYDMRGFGKTVVPPGRFAHYEDSAALLAQLGVEKACVLGASFGGSVAIDSVLARPRMVDALVLCAPAIGGYQPSSVEMQRFFAEEDEALERGDLDAATELNLRMWVDGPYRTPDRVDPLLRERVRKMQLNAFALPIPEDVESLSLSPPALKRLGEIQIPTLVISGDQDVPEFLKMADIVARGIPEAKRVIIPGAAHLPSMEKPEIFNRAVLDFFSELHL